MKPQTKKYTLCSKDVPIVICLTACNKTQAKHYARHYLDLPPNAVIFILGANL